MKVLTAAFTILVFGAAGASPAQRAGGAVRAKTLDIYFIDVEGGQSTLVVTPAGQSLLIDAGYAGNSNRDPDRIMTAARAARIDHLDYLLVTHFHADHAGGVPEVAKRLPVTTFVDYGEPSGKDATAAGPFAAYKPVRERGKQLHPAPGDRLPLAGADVDVVSAGGNLLTKPLSGTSGAGQPNPACAKLKPQKANETENARSLGIRLKFGRFRSSISAICPPKDLAAVACPTNLVGHADLYLVPHHGNDDTAIPSRGRRHLAALRHPQQRDGKGGGADAFDTLREVASGRTPGSCINFTAAQNFPDAFIANIGGGPNDTGAWIKVSAEESGRFTVTNGRTGVTKSYK